jgi:hypothetical protein
VQKLRRKQRNPRFLKFGLLNFTFRINGSGPLSDIPHQFAFRVANCSIGTDIDLVESRAVPGRRLPCRQKVYEAGFDSMVDGDLALKLSTTHDHFAEAYLRNYVPLWRTTFRHAQL